MSLGVGGLEYCDVVVRMDRWTKELRTLKPHGTTPPTRWPLLRRPNAKFVSCNYFSPSCLSFATQLFIAYWTATHSSHVLHPLQSDVLRWFILPSGLCLTNAWKSPHCWGKQKPCQETRATWGSNYPQPLWLASLSASPVLVHSSSPLFFYFNFN